MWQFQPTEGKSSPTQFRLRQLVDKPTRGDQILDLVLTNLSDLYDKNAVDILPLFGLSDHDVRRCVCSSKNMNLSRRPKQENSSQAGHLGQWQV